MTLIPLNVHICLTSTFVLSAWNTFLVLLFHHDKQLNDLEQCGAKRDNGMFQPTWHCCMCCNLANMRVDFEDLTVGL
jgi:hypothetical protein